MHLKITPLLLVFMVTPVTAGVIHKWVDDKGVTHYSDEAPDSATIQSSQIELPESAAPVSRADNDYYSIANQWARMHQESLEREKLRLEAEQTRAEVKPSVTNVYVDEKENNGYALVYRKPYYKKRHKTHKAYHPGYTRRYYQSEYPPGLHPGRKTNTGAIGTY